MDAVLRLDGRFDANALAKALRLPLIKSRRRGEKWNRTSKAPLRSDHANLSVPGRRTANEPLRRLQRAINGLDPASRAVWNRLHSASLDFWLDIPDDMAIASFRFDRLVVAELASMGVEIEISLYHRGRP